MSQIGTIIALIATGWGALVLFYLGPGTARVRTTQAWSYVAISLLALGALFVPGAREPAAIVFVAAFALVLLIWGKERPSNDHELVYVVADERDAIRGRTNYRNSPPEQIYLFRLMAPIENGRRIFLDYMRDINELREHPRFYNALTTNCTTMIFTHSAVNFGHLPYSWKVLLSGYTPEYAYERGRLNQSLPFEELKERSHINAAARAADQASDFSRRIRADLP